MIDTNTQEQLARIEKKTRKAQKREQVLTFAKETLGLDKRRAKALRKLGSGFFKLADDGLRFRGAGNKLLATDSKECKDFFAKKFDFLLLPPQETGDHPQVNQDLVAKAKLGNVTAKSMLFKEMHGDKPKSAETETLAALDKVLAGDTQQRDDKGKFVADDTKGKERSDASNPWSRAGWNITAQGRAAKNDFARAQRLAAAAGSFIGATRPAEV